jgi:hypothetical protein
MINYASKRRIRSDAELRGAAQHVKYEIVMLVFSADHLEGGHSSPATRPSGDPRNMALDSFLLHFRNLRAFLCPLLQKTSDDDVCAGDFLNEPAEKNLGNARRLAGDKVRLDKMLAHLSYSRDRYIETGEHMWHSPEMLITMMEELGGFLDLLSKERRAWFPEELKA